MLSNFNAQTDISQTESESINNQAQNPNLEIVEKAILENSKIPASQFLRLLGQLKSEDLLGTKGLGEVLIKNLTDFVSSKRYNEMLEKFEKLESAGGKILEIEMPNQNQETVEGFLSGQVICITGTFDETRPQIAKKLEALGAKVVDTVSKTTTILLAGQSAGSKLEKAKKLGIKIVEKLTDLFQVV